MLIEIVARKGDESAVYLCKKIIESDLEFSYTTTENIKETKIKVDGKEVTSKDVYNLILERRKSANEAK